MRLRFYYWRNGKWNELFPFHLFQFLNNEVHQRLSIVFIFFPWRVTKLSRMNSACRYSFTIVPNLFCHCSVFLFAPSVMWLLTMASDTYSIVLIITLTVLASLSHEKVVEGKTQDLNAGQSKNLRRLARADFELRTTLKRWNETWGAHGQTKSGSQALFTTAVLT